MAPALFAGTATLGTASPTGGSGYAADADVAAAARAARGPGELCCSVLASASGWDGARRARVWARAATDRGLAASGPGRRAFFFYLLRLSAKQKPAKGVLDADGQPTTPAAVDAGAAAKLDLASAVGAWLSLPIESHPRPSVKLLCHKAARTRDDFAAFCAPYERARGADDGWELPGLPARRPLKKKEKKAKKKKAKKKEAAEAAADDDDGNESDDSFGVKVVIPQEVKDVLGGNDSNNAGPGTKFAAGGRHKGGEKGRAPPKAKDGGGSAEGYTWTQDSGELCLHIPLVGYRVNKALSAEGEFAPIRASHPVVSGNQVTVDVSAGTLEVAAQGHVVLAGKLPFPCDPAETTWSLVKVAGGLARVEVTLTKETKGHYWKCALVGGAGVDTAHLEKGRDIDREERAREARYLKGQAIPDAGPAQQGQDANAAEGPTMHKVSDPAEAARILKEHPELAGQIGSGGIGVNAVTSQTFEGTSSFAWGGGAKKKEGGGGDA